MADFWWDAGEPPFPSKDMLANRIGMGARQVQRHLAALEKRGFVKRIARHRGQKNQTANGYDMGGLVKKLVELEPEFRRMIDQKRKRRQKVEAAAS